MSTTTLPAPSELPSFRASELPKVRPPFRPDVEGLRGIAVLLVVLYHAAVPGFSGGFVGVDVFFVLSGYLITWLLVREVEATGTVSLRTFYARRFRRLLPAMAVLLTAVAAFAFVFYAPVEQTAIARTALATAAYLSNMHFGAEATDYLAGAAEANPLLHTWSLSVEEQFYAFWPVLVLVALTGFGRLRPSRRRLLWVMVAVCVVSFALTLYLNATLRAHWAFFSSPTRAWEFAIGGFGVLLPLVEGRRLRSVLGWLGLAGVLAAGALYTSRTPFPGWFALLPAVGTVLALRAGMEADGSAREGTVLARVLGWRPLQELGRLSYSWYLWHWPVLVFAAGLSFSEIHQLDPLYRAGLVLFSLLLAEGSYRLVENPLRHLRYLGARSRRGLAMGASLTAFGVVLGLGWHMLATNAADEPEQVRYVSATKDRQKGCIATMTTTEVVECLRGDTTAVRTIALIGDSHADQWLPALDAAGQEAGFRIVSLTHSSCPLAERPFYHTRLGRVLDECEAWRPLALARLAEWSPKIIVASWSIGYGLSEAEHLDLAAAFYRALGQSAGRIVHVRDTPRPGFDVPGCLARTAWRKGPESCVFDAAGYDEVRDWQDAAAQLAGADVLDLNDHICDRSGPVCSVERNGFVLFRDSNHLSASFAASLAPALAEQLRRVIGEAPKVGAL